MTPRRVLITTDAVGGVWTHSLELARGLSEAGVEVMLVVVGPAPSDAQRADAIEVPGLVLVVPRLELEWQDRAGPLAMPARQRMLGLARAFRPDVVHCNGYREAGAGFRAPVVLAAHSCVRTWWRACRGENLPPDWAAYAEGVRSGLAAATALVAPSEAFLAEFCTAWSHVPRPRVIRNGLDSAPVGGARRREVILAAGRLWDEAKNVSALAAIAPDLPWPVQLAGELPPGGVGGPVEWLGRLERGDLLRVMEQAAIFVAPVRYEPFGLAILEAANAGCALVLGNVPSLVELWGDAAKFVPALDGRALRRALLDLISDPAALAGAQAAARRRGGGFGRQRMVDEYLALYGELLSQSVARDRAA